MRKLINTFIIRHLPMGDSQNGFSLPEILIGLGMIGFAALGFMKLQENMVKGQMTTEAKMSELEMKRIITTLLLDKKACLFTFSASNIGSNVTLIKNSAGGTLYQTGKSYEMNSIKITKMSTVDKNVVNADGTRMIDLVIGLERIKKQTYGQVKDIRIPLIVRAAGPTSPITECFSNTDALVLTAMEETCLSLNGVWNASLRKCHFETFRVGTSTAQRFNVTSNGNVGIGTALPLAKLDVAGEVKFGNTSSPCASQSEGQQRYNPTTKSMEFCNGTVWAAIGGGFSDICLRGNGSGACNCNLCSGPGAAWKLVGCWDADGGGGLGVPNLSSGLVNNSHYYQVLCVR